MHKVALFLIFFLFLPLCAYSGNNYANTYSEPFQTYEEYVHLEEEVFGKLVFSLSSFNPELGQKSLKVILDDQLDRKWVFEIGGSIGSPRTIYLLFELFGLDAQEAHFTYLSINGKTFPGVIYKLVEGKTTLNEIKLDSLASAQLDPLLKMQVLDWFIKNINAGKSNFVITGPERDRRLVRINNRMQEKSLAPSLNSYYGLWEDYISARIPLNLRKNYCFVEFVVGFPEALLKKVFYGEAFVDRPELISILKSLLERRGDMANNFARFYSDIASRRGEKFRAPQNCNFRRIANDIQRHLNAQIVRLKQDKARLKRMPPGKQQDIEVAFSYDAFNIASVVYVAGRDSRISVGDLSELCNYALEKLRALESSTLSQAEKEAIRYYSAEVARIKNYRDFSSISRSSYPSRIYRKLLQTYEKYVRLEREVFGKLDFTLSSFQLKKGASLKFVLDDQLGRKWLFKMRDKESGMGIRTTYLLFRLFGLDTPEIHLAPLKINGKIFYGSIQRFIDNGQRPRGSKLSTFPSQCIDYLLKTHIFYWLIENVDAHKTNFILSGKGKDMRIIRVDNKIEINGDFKELRYDYVPPWSDCSANYYCIFWKDYISRKISLSLNHGYCFAAFIQGLPDDSLKKLFFSEVFGEHPATIGSLSNILGKKQSLAEDFARFYSDIASRRGEKFRAPQNCNFRRIANDIQRHLNAQIVRLKQDKARLKRMPPGKQEDIEVAFSYDAYKVVFALDCAYRDERLSIRELNEVRDYALDRLRVLELLSANEREKEEIRGYMEEVKESALPSE